jgi:RNA ligase
MRIHQNQNVCFQRLLMILPSLPNEITTIEDIQRLVMQDFRDWQRYGNVSIHAWDGRLIFNYTKRAVYEGRWNFFECASRGLIIDIQTGEIVARGFDKFWNWLQDGRQPAPDAHIIAITDKIDGSLGVLYRHRGQYRIATRGSFDSPQALWATEFLNARYDLTGLPDDLTLLFEIIYPANRVVVDYGEREDLVLLAARKRDTGDYLPFYPNVAELGQRYGFTLPQTYSFSDVAQIIEQARALGVTHEGFVAEFSDGSRFKFKGSRYTELQRMILSLTFKNTLKAVASGSLNEIFELVPDEFLTEVRSWVAEIETRVQSVKETIETLYAQSPQTGRREFAIWVTQNHPQHAKYLFTRFDRRPLEPLIYLNEVWEDHAPPARLTNEDEQ